MLNRLREPLYRFRDRSIRHMLILDDIEALGTKKFILRRTGVLEIHIFALRIHGTHECEGHQIHMSGFRHLRVQLTYRARAEIPRILILRIRIRDGFVDLFKFGIRDDGLPAEHQITGEGNPRRDVIKHPRVLCDDFTDLTVATGDCLHQLPGMVAQDDGEPVHLPAEKALFIPQPGGQFLDGLRLIEAQHRARMTLLRKLRQHLEADTLGRRAAENHAGLLFELLKLIIELVIAQVRHDLIAIHIVHTGRFIQGADELLHACKLLVFLFVMGNTHSIFTCSSLLFFISMSDGGRESPSMATPLSKNFSAHYFPAFSSISSSRRPSSDSSISRYCPGFSPCRVRSMIRMRFSFFTS